MVNLISGWLCASGLLTSGLQLLVYLEIAGISSCTQKDLIPGKALQPTISAFVLIDTFSQLVNQCWVHLCLPGLHVSVSAKNELISDWLVATHHPHH